MKFNIILSTLMIYKVLQIKRRHKNVYNFLLYRHNYGQNLLTNWFSRPLSHDNGKLIEKNLNFRLLFILLDRRPAIYLSI